MDGREVIMLLDEGIIRLLNEGGVLLPLDTKEHTVSKPLQSREPLVHIDDDWFSILTPLVQIDDWLVHLGSPSRVVFLSPRFR